MHLLLLFVLVFVYFFKIARRGANIQHYLKFAGARLALSPRMNSKVGREGEKSSLGLIADATRRRTRVRATMKFVMFMKIEKGSLPK